jgi:hypothetical protein
MHTGLVMPCGLQAQLREHVRCEPLRSTKDDKPDPAQLCVLPGCGQLVIDAWEDLLRPRAQSNSKRLLQLPNNTQEDGIPILRHFD